MIKKLVILSCLLLGGCATTGNVEASHFQGGFNAVSSWYGSEAGHHTADGAVWRPHGLTVAHKTLPFGTKLRLTNILNHRVVVATVTDRGPWVPGRVIDSSEGVADALGFKNNGIGHLYVEVLNK